MHLRKDTCGLVLVLTLLVNLFVVEPSNWIMMPWHLLILWKHSFEIWCVSPWNQAAQHRVSLCSWYTLHSTGTTSSTDHNKGKINLVNLFPGKEWQPSQSVWSTLLNQICQLVTPGCAYTVVLAGPWPPAGILASIWLKNQHSLWAGSKLSYLSLDCFAKATCW